MRVPPLPWRRAVAGSQGEAGKCPLLGSWAVSGSWDSEQRGSLRAGTSSAGWRAQRVLRGGGMTRAQKSAVGSWLRVTASGPPEECEPVRSVCFPILGLKRERGDPRSTVHLRCCFYITVNV